MSSAIALTSSTRENSDTKKMLFSIIPENQFTCIDLLHYQIAPYHYENMYPPEDDFLAIIHKMLVVNTLLITTPVYWYSMSGLLKIFFDRLTDLTRVHKTVGRQLAGKSMIVMATGTDQDLPAGFEVPFQLTAKYFDISFQGCFYFCTHRNAAPPTEKEKSLFRKTLHLI